MQRAAKTTRLTDSEKELADNHLRLVDIVAALSRKKPELAYANDVLGEPELRQVASLALVKAAGRYDGSKGEFSSYAICTMIFHVTDAAKRFLRFREGKRTSYKSIPVVVPVIFPRLGMDRDAQIEKGFVPSPVQPVFNPALDDDEKQLLHWACDTVPGKEGEILRQTFLGERFLKDVGRDFGLDAQNAWHSRENALDTLRLLVSYSSEGGLVRVPRLDCKPREGALLVATALEERKWKPASWVYLLKETELTPASLNAALGYKGWFSVHSRGLYWMDASHKKAFRLATGRTADGKEVRRGKGE